MTQPSLGEPPQRPDPPLILVCNDDGIWAPGIKALAESVADLGEVWVVAPDREQSAVGHGISLDSPLRAVELAERRIAVSGTPADCVYFAIVHRLPRRPDVVLSGINRGNNLADDMFYSGTVAAAIEACLMGVPAMAVSMTHGGDFAAAGAVARRVAQRLVTDGLPARTFLNLNVPRKIRDGARVRIAPLGVRYYGRDIQSKEDPRGRPYYWIGGPEMGHEPIPGSDCVVVADGDVSLTPVRLSLNDQALIEALEDWAFATSELP